MGYERWGPWYSWLYCCTKFRSKLWTSVSCDAGDQHCVPVTTLLHDANVATKPSLAKASIVAPNFEVSCEHLCLFVVCGLFVSQFMAVASKRLKQRNCICVLCKILKGFGVFLVCTEKLFRKWLLKLLFSLSEAFFCLSSWFFRQCWHWRSLLFVVQRRCFSHVLRSC